MNCPPKISVVMSAYNAERFIGEAIASILNQTWKDFEFVIVNDGSTDGTADVIRSFDDSRIRFVEQENQGAIRSLNRGIMMARGEYIARFDADDIAMPHRLERQLAFLETHSGCAMVGSPVIQIDEDGREIKVERYPLGYREIKENLWIDVPFAHPTVMFRKAAFLKAGLYREKLEPVDDYDLWFRMAELFDIENIDEPLCKMRKHISSLNLSKRFDFIRLGEFVKELARERMQHGKDRLDSMSRADVEAELERIMPGTERSRRNVAAASLLFIAEATYCTGNYGRSVHHLWKSLCLNPFSSRAWTLAAKMPVKMILGFVRKGRKRTDR